MIIECETCGSYTEMNNPPRNNICPVCCAIGSLFIQTEPTEEQLKWTEEVKKEKENG